MNITKYEGKYYKEVKRVAEQGELVKVVSTDAKRPGKDTYQIGDIFNADPHNIIFPGYVYISAGQLADYEYVTLEPLTVMTNEPHPEIAEGSTFVTLDENSPMYEIGETVRLSDNDNSKHPYFNNDNACIHWYRLAPLNIIYKDKPKDCVTAYDIAEGHDHTGIIRTCPKCGQLLPKKRTYTAEQIQEAKDIVYRIMTNLIGGVTIDFLFLGEAIKCVRLVYQGGDNWKEMEGTTATCSKNDAYDESIGMMVAICKLTGEPMPKWVRGK